MEYLIDTNVALWSLAAPERLSATARSVLENPALDVGFSSISIVEFELKRDRLLSEYRALLEQFAQQLVAQGFCAIPYTASDATGLCTVTPNTDPFDRMLCAQAIARDLDFVTADRDLLDYEPLRTTW